MRNLINRTFRLSPMGRVGTLLSGLVVLGVLGACGDEPAGVGFGGAPPSISPAPPPVPDGPTAPAGGEEVPADQVDAAGLPEGYPRLVWTQEDGSVLGAYGQEGGCTQVSADLVEQTADSVLITFVEATPTTGPCTMDLRFPPLAVQLDAPLGDRTVVLEFEQVGPPRR